MKLDYGTYLDKILGGWIGKSAGGAAGARFEGFKGWIEINADQLFPETMPPNDDLDLQVLWLSVLERKGRAVTSNDLAEAWLEGCWYPFNEYGNFRRNYRLGIKPPYSGTFHNAFFDTGMGCPIRSEIWGYIFPGAPDLAARYARLDGLLDHSAQSVGGEEMFAAMASLAFFIPDVRRLVDMTIHYLPPDTTIARLASAALKAYDEGLTLPEARTRLLALEGHPEACDSRLNVPFTLLALLYGKNDLQETLLDALRCGYDTDCTCATAAAFIGQILGAARIPENIRGPVGDALVMGIQYRRPEMTLSALARDTARIGFLFAKDYGRGVVIENAPEMTPLPPLPPARPRLRMDYSQDPVAIPGDQVLVQVTVEGSIRPQTVLQIDPPAGWEALPATVPVDPLLPTTTFALKATERVHTWSLRNLFRVRLLYESEAIAQETFGLEGAAPWAFLGVYFDPYPGADVHPQVLTTREMMKQVGAQAHRAMQHHFARLEAPYIENEASPDAVRLYHRWSRILGRPAVIYARADHINLADLIGLQGEYVAYLIQELISPDSRQVNLVIGHNDGYRLYVNGELAGESDEMLWWTPYNSVHPVKLKKGRNRLVLKLLKRGDRLDFSLGIREWRPDKGHNALDWCTDLSYGNPLLW